MEKPQEEIRKIPSKCRNRKEVVKKYQRYISIWGSIVLAATFFFLINQDYFFIKSAPALTVLRLTVTWFCCFVVKVLSSRQLTLRRATSETSTVGIGGGKCPPPLVSQDWEDTWASPLDQ